MMNNGHSNVISHLYKNLNGLWVRGLKLRQFVLKVVLVCRTPRGCVD